MACFAVPTAVGIVTTALGKKIPKELHTDWFNLMVWGGALALGVEHVAHGEVVPWPPFLTAMSNPAETAVMLDEMAAIGIPMTIGLVVAWAAMVLVYEKLIIKHQNKVDA